MYILKRKKNTKKIDIRSEITDTLTFVANVPPSNGGLKSSNPGLDATAMKLGVWGFAGVCGLLGAWAHVLLRATLAPPGNPSRNAAAWQMRGAGAHNRASHLRMQWRVVAFREVYI